jgi:sugar O-acyltransferase (sialic acid O-acetyltransferase NeuD family)
MTKRKILIIGAGGSGREILSLIEDINKITPGSWDIQGFASIDIPNSEVLARLNAAYLGKPQDLKKNIPNLDNWHFVVGIGNPSDRRQMEKEGKSQGLKLATLIHPKAQIGSDVEIKEGSVICANVVLTTNIRIGRSVQVNIGCIIAHDVVIEDYVTLAQSVNLTGNVTVKSNSVLYTKSTVLPNIVIEENAIVGAGSLVINDVQKNTKVAGVPAKALA